MLDLDNVTMSTPGTMSPADMLAMSMFGNVIEDGVGVGFHTLRIYQDFHQQALLRNRATHSLRVPISISGDDHLFIKLFIFMIFIYDDFQSVYIVKQRQTALTCLISSLSVSKEQ